MDKTIYLAIGSDVVEVRLHPTTKTVGRAKEALSTQGIASKKYLWIYKEKILGDTEQLAVPSFATISCTLINQSESKSFLNIKSILPTQLINISDIYSQQLLSTYQDLKNACEKRRSSYPSYYILERSYKCQFVELRCQGPGSGAYIDIPLLNDSIESLETDLVFINEFVKVTKNSDNLPISGAYTLVKNSPKAGQFVRWLPVRPMRPEHYKVTFTNGLAALQLNNNNWTFGYSGEYSITDLFLLRNTLTLDADLSLKSRVQQVQCLNDNSVRPVALHFEGEENNDPWHVLVRNIAATWDVPIDNIVSIMNNDTRIDDKYGVMKLRRNDLVTFVIVDPVVLEIPFVELKLIKIIGEGSYGMIYLADWCGQKVAVKKFKSSLPNEHVFAEAKALVRLQHKHIVSLTGVTTDPNTNETMIVMEYMENGSLEDNIALLMRENSVLPIPEVVRIALDVAKGLRYLHQRKTIHRDLKSANVLLYDNNKRAKLSDFGTARFLTHSSKAKTVIGTLGFMAPEMLQNVAYTENADVYSFGALLYQMLTASILPIIFAEADRSAKIRSAVVDQNFQKLIIKCCKTDPISRPTIHQCIRILKNRNQPQRTESSVETVTNTLGSLLEKILPRHIKPF